MKTIYTGSAGEYCIYILNYIDDEPYIENKCRAIGEYLIDRCETANLSIRNYVLEMIPQHISTINTERGLYHKVLLFVKLKRYSRRDHLAPRAGNGLPEGMVYNLERFNSPKCLIVKTIMQNGVFDDFMLDRPDCAGTSNCIREIGRLVPRSQTPVVAIYNKTYDMYDDEYSKVVIKIHDTMADAINDPEKTWTHAYSINDSGSGLHQSRYNSKLKLNAFYIRDTLIIADNKNGVNSILPQLKKIIELNPHMTYIDVNQYSIYEINNGVNFFDNLVRLGGRRYDYHENITDIILVNYSMIKSIKVSNASSFFGHNAYTQAAVRATVKYNINYRGSLREMQLDTIIDANLAGTNVYKIVVPFDKEKDVHTQVLDLCIDYFRGEIDKNSWATKYKELMIPPLGEDDSVLDRWFTLCAANSNKEKEQLLMSYKMLKDRLITEYKRAEIYLKHNDIKQKMPIPAVRIDDDSLRNIHNRLALEFINKEYREFGNIEIRTPVVDRMLMVKYILPLSKGKHAIGRVELNKLYKKDTNTITISTQSLMQNSERRSER